MDMTYTDILQAALALVIVLGLIGLCALAARRLGLGGARGAARFGRDRRLSVIETLALDPRRRLVLLRRDETEHLVILGPNGETVVERGVGQGGEQDRGQGGGHSGGQNARASFAEQLSGLEPLADPGADLGGGAGSGSLAARRERRP
ncbi:MAG: flagellar biosynthetic protein FliO [Rhodospirillales bacterium]